MCGRFTLRASPSQIAKAIGVALNVNWPPRYNIAPTQDVLAVRLVDGRREPALLHWGLVPSWADDPAIGNRMINARAEGVDSKPSFRQAFRKSRCLVVADGFYEWTKVGKSKQPYYFTMKDNQPFAFAGLAEHWSRGELTIDSCTIITTEPNSVAAPIHDRMPVILDAADYDAWISPQSSPADLHRLLRPFTADKMECRPASKLVNSPRNDSPDCIA